MEGDGAIIFEHACKMGLEGIVSKRRDLPYRSGRVKSWIKVKNPASPVVLRVIEDGVWWKAPLFSLSGLHRAVALGSGSLHCELFPLFRQSTVTFLAKVLTCVAGAALEGRGHHGCQISKRVTSIYLRTLRCYWACARGCGPCSLLNPENRHNWALVGSTRRLFRGLIASTASRADRPCG